MTKETVQLGFRVRVDHVRSLDEVRAQLQALEPIRAISRSNVVREAFDIALPILAARLREREAVSA